MQKQHISRRSYTLGTIVLAGLAGGLAEILWIGAISPMTTFNATAVAQEITASLIPGVPESIYNTFIGIGIHLVLSILLAAAFLLTIGRMVKNRTGLTGQLVAGVSTLLTVWVINFFVILPILNPVFVVLVSYGPSLISKVFFAIAMVLVSVYRIQQSATVLRGYQEIQKLYLNGGVAVTACNKSFRTESLIKGGHNYGS